MNPLREELVLKCNQGLSSEFKETRLKCLVHGHIALQMAWESWNYYATGSSVCRKLERDVYRDLRETMRYLIYRSLRQRLAR